MMKLICANMLLATMLATTAHAEANQSKETLKDLENQGYKTNYVIPIFSQIVALRAPKGFHIDYENATPTQYIIEAVPEGETVKVWSRMMTITGYKELAKKPDIMPINLIQSTANGFQKACPSSFSAQGLWQGDISGFKAYAAVLGCGTSPTTGGKTSEMALIVAIKGQSDFYTLQFAERNQASATPIKIDPKKWNAQLKQMSPIKVCNKVKDEKPPYPSCIDKP